MGLEGPGLIERALQRVLVPIFVGSGAIVASGFFFPEFVGTGIPGPWWLVLSLVFFGTGLGYLAVQPSETDNVVDAFDPRALMRVRRRGVVGNLAEFIRGQDRATFGIPLLALSGFFLLQGVAPTPTNRVIDSLRTAITGELGWLFAGVILVSTIVCLALIISPWGDVKLGGPEAEPAYTLPVYFTMIFTAGIAAGIVFWGPAEALFHYQTPPPLFGVEPRSDAAVEPAMTYALFHWGFSAWSAYLALGLPIAYFVYERNAPLRVSAILTPFLGADTHSSRLAKLVDIMAIFATIGGITTSVALVSRQFLAGINYQWGVSVGLIGPLLFVVGLSAIFVLSAQSGVHRGIRRISVTNIGLFAAFVLLLAAVGPRDALLDIGLPGVGGYARHFASMSAHTGGQWVADWTIWNWVWWFSWAPFAGLFIAALSRGRRIRTVVLTGFVATGLASITWFVLLGSTALHLEHTHGSEILASIAEHPGGEAVAGFSLLDPLPAGELLMFTFLALIIVFMTTSADTSTLVIGILATPHGRAPTTITIVFWGILQATTALVVLWTDSAELLQGVAVLTGGPFAVISLVALAGLFLGLHGHDRQPSSLSRRVMSWIHDHR